MDFVNFSIAKKLKEKGFREECLCHYVDVDLVYNIESSIANNQLWFCHNKYDNIWHRDNYDAPTISQVLKWLREVHNVYVDIGLYVITKDMRKYNINVYHNKNRRDLMYSGIHLTKECSKYEEACEVALKYVLENLI